MEGKGEELNLNNKFSLMPKKPCSSTKSVCLQVIHKESSDHDEKLIFTPEPKHFDSASSDASTRFSLSSTSSFFTTDEKSSKTLNTKEFSGIPKTLDFDDCANQLPAKRPHKILYKSEQDLDQILSRMDQTVKEAFFDGESMIVLEELQVEQVKKLKTCDFLSKIREKVACNKGSFNFVKGFLRNDLQDDFLEVLPPRSVEGFTVKRNVKNPRDVMIENLRNSINDKKTSCLDYEDIFSKPQTDLPGKKQKIHENFTQVASFDMSAFKGCKEDSGAESISTAESYEMSN